MDIQILNIFFIKPPILWNILMVIIGNSTTGPYMVAIWCFNTDSPVDLQKGKEKRKKGQGAQKVLATTSI